VAEPIEISREVLPTLSALEREWRALEKEAERGFFLSWAWIGTWLATLPSSVAPFLLRASQRGTTLGLAIGVEHDGPRGKVLPARGLYLNATGDRDLDAIYIEHNGFLCAMSAERAVLAALAAWFGRNALGLGALSLPGIAAPARPGRLLDERREAPGFAIDLARIAAAGDVAAVLGSGARQQLRRALRGYESHAPLSLVEAGNVDEALDFFEAMKDLHIASWQRRRRRHAFSTPHFERFHRALIERTFAQGGIQLLKIAAGAEAIGYLYNFCRSGIVYAYQSGFDDGQRGLSPGVVSHALAIAHNAASGARLYDFLAGANRLKESFSTMRYTLVWQVLRRPRLDHRLRAAARSIRRGIGR
jgi:CelD/BcsL family acetyltransferase involved in cellulose biosynthesis